MPVPPGGAVEFPVGNENEGAPEPAGALVFPDFVERGAVQVVELPPG